MAMWCWSVQHASEFTPGPWGVCQLEVPAGFPPEVWALSQAGDKWQCVGTALATGGKPYPGGPRLWSEDREQDCNVRLMADAPAMLLLLAKVAERIEATERRPVPNGQAWARLYVEVCEMLRRHVRLDLGGIPDEAHRAPDYAADSHGPEGQP